MFRFKASVIFLLFFGFIATISADISRTLCEDEPGWVDSAGDTCLEYELNPDYCDEFGTCCDNNDLVANTACCICGGGYNYLESCIDDNLFRDCNGYTCEDYSAYWFNDDYYLNLDDPSHPLSNYDYDDYESFCYYGLPEDNCPDPMTGFFAVDRCCACGGGLVVETTHPIGASSMQPTQNPSQPLTSHPNIISSENPSQILLKSTPSLFPLTQPSQEKRTEEPSKIPTSIPTLPIHLSMVPTETFSLQPVNKKINENQFETQVPSLVDYEQPVTLIKVPNIPHDKSSTNSSSSSSSSSDVNLRNHKRYVVLLNLIGTMVIQL